MSELDTLLNVPTEIEVGGETLELAPMRFGQLAQAMKIVGSLAGKLAAGSVDLFELLAEESDRLMNLAALLTGKPREWVEQLPADEAVTLLAGLYQVNADFFARRVGPALTQAINAAAASTTGANPTTAQAMPEAATPGPTSSAS